jgi:hypothetical protein
MLVYDNGVSKLTGDFLKIRLKTKHRIDVNLISTYMLNEILFVRIHFRHIIYGVI